MIQILQPNAILSPSCLTVRSILSQNKPFTTSARRVVEAHLQCQSPEPTIKWYYATDIPISKPSWFNYSKTETAKKFVPFSDYDSKRIEGIYQKYYTRKDEEVNPIVDVSEDRLFQVNVQNNHLSPVYWEGPVYEVRRGFWFGSDGTPLPDQLTKEIESGYKDLKPYLFDEERKRQASDKKAISKAELARFEEGEVEEEIKEQETEDDDVIRLSNGKAVIYFNNTSAAIFPDSMVNGFQLPIIRNLGVTAVPLMDVTQIQRGFTDELTSSMFENASVNDIIPDLPNPASFFSSEEPVKKSVNYSNQNDGDETKQNHQMKDVMENDFDTSTSKQNSVREVDHLVLCVHGIGQILGTKYESINFAHNINMLRNTMKAVYRDNKKFRNLAYKNREQEGDTNHRIQVLPISWRHMIGFNTLPKVAGGEEPKEPRLPTLSQINVDGVKSLRNIIGDVALDILLYYETNYSKQILECVTAEINRVYDLYMERNPDFKGKVHILGHSLGSAISFDILSQQYNQKPAEADPKVDLNFDVSSLFCVGCPVGVFKLLGQKNIVHRKDLPSEFDPRDEALDFASPKCDNLYNLYHPCDPIGYRLEPLIKPRFSKFKAQEAPFATEGINTQIKGLATFTDELSERLGKATNWFLNTKKKTKTADGIKDQFSDENALGDIVSSIVKSKDEDVKVKAKGKMSPEDFEQLIKFNKGARVDYCLPMGVFDISLVSAISAHVSYFEDKDTAGFVMGELLSEGEDGAREKEVVYKE